MDKRKVFAAALPAIIIVIIIVFSSATYTLDETKQAVIRQFKDPVKNPVVKEPGLHFKVPFIQEVTRFDKRTLAWDGDPDQLRTLGRKQIFIDTTARWQIEDPLMFFKRLRNESSAQSRLDDIIGSIVRNQISSTELVDIVRSQGWEYKEEDIERVTTEDEQEDKQVLREEIKVGRKKLTQKILQKAKKELEDIGITLVDFRIKRINYVESTRKDVFDRMISERKRIAEKFRAEGKGKSAEIIGETKRDKQEIISEAQREAETIRGEADATATDVYNQAYSQEPGFYTFYRTLESYEKTLGANAVFVLDTDSDYFKYLRDIKSDIQPISETGDSGSESE